MALLTLRCGAASGCDVPPLSVAQGFRVFRLYWLERHRQGGLTEEDNLLEKLRAYETHVAELERKVGQLTMEIGRLRLPPNISPADRQSRRDLAPAPISGALSFKEVWKGTGLRRTERTSDLAKLKGLCGHRGVSGLRRRISEE